jgi:two-component system OmpR family response regulator
MPQLIFDLKQQLGGDRGIAGDNPPFKSSIPDEKAGRVLVIEDDQVVRSFMEEYLTSQGYRVFAIESGETLFDILADNDIDLAILDLMLPGDDGLELIKRIRAKSDLPIIIVTAKGDVIERIVGLEIGADDYLPKPFEPRELLARMRSVLRRTQRSPAPAAEKEQIRNVARFAGWRLDPQQRQFTSAENEKIDMTAAEFNLLSAFVNHPNHVLTREQLIDLSYGRSMCLFERSIDTLVARVRRKIEKDRHKPTLIKTVRSFGYVFTPTVEWS